MKGYLYIIKNKVNNKVYIGKTYKSIESRFRQHIQDSQRIDLPKKQNKLYRAFNKHGIENFYIELIDKFEEGLLEEKEIEYIALHNSFHKGYNSTLGGDGKRTLELDENLIVKKWEDGKSINKIASYFVISPDSVKKVLYNKVGYLTKEVNEKVPFVIYDKNWNRVIKASSRYESINIIKNIFKLSVPYSVCQMIDKACDKGNIAYQHHWQKESEIYHDGKEFNRKFDKNQYIAHKECVCINEIWYAINQDSDLSLDMVTGVLGKVTKKDQSKRVCTKPSKEELSKFLDKSSKELGEIYKVGRTTINRWLREYNLKRIESPLDEKLVISYYKKGMNIKTISSLLHKNNKDISSILKKEKLLDKWFKHCLYAFSKKENTIHKFESLIKAKRFLNNEKADDKIKLCIKGKRKSAFGYIWRSPFIENKNDDYYENKNNW